MAQKPLLDKTIPEGDYKVPANVRAIYADIVDRAKRTYPDHSESRERMVQQELLQLLSGYTYSLAALRETVNVVMTQRDQLTQELAGRKKSWWLRMLDRNHRA